MAKRMGAKTIEIEASHLALISHPDAITNLILEADSRPVAVAAPSSLFSTPPRALPGYREVNVCWNLHLSGALI
jgi:hypothetical protein